MDIDTYVPEQHLIESETNSEAINSIETLLPFVDKPEPIGKRKHPNPDELPETITILRDPITNGIVYLVGTAHFSEKRQREVTQVEDSLLFSKNTNLF